MELYRNPDNKFVAGFIGSPSMNFLNGTVSGGKVDVPALGRAVSVSATLPPEGTAVILGVRPEHIMVGSADQGATVNLAEALGGVSYTHLTAPTGEHIIVEERGDERGREGDTVAVSFEEARAMVFDAKTEARIR